MVRARSVTGDDRSVSADAAESVSVADQSEAESATSGHGSGRELPRLHAATIAGRCAERAAGRAGVATVRGSARHPESSGSGDKAAPRGGGVPDRRDSRAEEMISFAKGGREVRPPFSPL